MNYEIIAQIILFGSTVGLGTIIFRKIPLLITLPEDIVEKEKEPLVLRLKNRIKRNNPLRDFSYNIFLQKILTKIRILSLKTDKKTFYWIKKLRENRHRKKMRENDNYWEEIQKSTKK